MRLVLALVLSTVAFGAEDDWSRWRGPNDDGMARGDVPHEWSDTKNIAWKVNVPGRGFSSPVIWGNKLFVTTAVPMGDAKRPKQLRMRAAEDGEREAARA